MCNTPLQSQPSCAGVGEPKVRPLGGRGRVDYVSDEFPERRGQRPLPAQEEQQEAQPAGGEQQEAQPAGGEQCSWGPEPEEEGRAGEIQTASLAEAYLDVCEAGPFTPARMAQLVAAGDTLVQAAEGWLHAAQAIKKAWSSRHGRHLDGILDPSLDGLLDDQLLGYLRSVARDGAPARPPPINTRVTAKPHRSAADHVQEAYQKLWKDAQQGRILLCSNGSDAFLRGVAASPWGRVAKLNPDRTVSPEGRFVHDQRTVNLTGSKYDHPPALQPRHAAVARRVLWWKTRHPEAPVLVAKRDIADAFKWIWVRDEDAGLFATELPGQSLGLDTSVVAIFLVLTFGWIGSPGEYMAYGWGIKELFEAHGPQDPQWNDAPAFHCDFLMDDDILVEPLIGLRPWQSASTLEWSACKLFGQGAINESKKIEEGAFGPIQLVWGLYIDTEREVIRLPEVKVAKVRSLTVNPIFDPGRRCFTLHDLQVLHGLLQFCCVACSALRPELGAISRLLGTSDPDRKMAVPRGDAQEVLRAWAEFEEALETVRVYTEAPDTWESHFTTGLLGLLNPRERLALPGELERLVWTGGDSTLHTLGCVDWQAGVYGVVPVAAVAGPLQAYAGEEQQEVIIAIGELLCIILLAVARMDFWDGRLVLYDTDNENTRIWLTKRRAGNRLAR